MRRLNQTKLFQLLNGTGGFFNPGDIDFKPVYEDFIHAVIALSASPEGDVPAYFTLHYTRLELQEYRLAKSDEGAGEKCAYHNLHR